MENEIFLSVAISFLFILVKLFEIKYFEKTAKPLKEIVRDAIIIFICSFSAGYGFSQLKNPIALFFGGNNTAISNKPTEIFTGNPEF